MKVPELSLPLLIAALLAIALAPSLASASTQTAVEVRPRLNDAGLGETFTVNITVSAVQNLYGLEVTLYWNSSILEIVGIDIRLGYESNTDGILHEIPTTASVQMYQNETSQEQGKYVLAASSTAPAPSFNGSGNIVRVSFQVKNGGSCSLNLQTRLYDKPAAGQVSTQIPHITQSGTFGEQVADFPAIYLVLAIVAAIIMATVAVTWLHRRTREVKGRTSPKESARPE